MDFDNEFCGWQPRTGWPIFSSPAVAPDGVVIVGTGEGFLIAIGDESW
ncbi:MAG: PQQ-binding-like beta-propeller repeat protein [Acidimicrobiia bacterium]